ncbi:MAG: hypothetical protein AMS24_02160 [Chlamydiae bacterium SM23_39]|nr:MAG: hypothetical protein AMS24_02160 [Chlamydiae bacterium SM23_39]
MSKIYFSNDLNILYEKLKKDLTKDLSFSIKKIVFIPNFHVKEWILQKFAKEDLSIFIKFLELKKILDFFNQFIFKEKKIFPNKMHLNFAIEQAILDLLEKKAEKNLSSSFFNFFDYLKNKKGSFSKKRINFLSDKIAELFLIYGSFGEKLNFRENSNWQIFLFNKVFKDEWTYPLKEFKDLKIKKLNYKLEINFFLISHMPNIYFSLLEKIPYQVNYYLLSPCKQFWQDLLSYREVTLFIKEYFKKRNHSEKGFLDLLGYLKNSNHLLANIGTLQKKYLKIMDNEESEFIEEYLEPKENSLLSSIKKNMLYLTEERVEFDCDSVQIHEASSKIREMEILHNYILNIIKEKNLSLSDIIVVSDDIDKYVSYIHFVFGGSKLKYKIKDIKNGSLSFLSQGILKLFSLVNSRWTKENIFDLFDNLNFQLKHKFSKEDVEVLKGWIEKANINFGIDLEHKKKILKNKKTTNITTWEHGIERILSSFIYESRSEKIDYSIEVPIDQLNFSDIDLFENFIKVFESLKEDIKKFEEGNFFNLKDWKNLIEEIIEKNFFLEEEFFSYKKFISDLSFLNKKFKDKVFEFDIIFKYLTKAFEYKRSSYQANMTNVISFSSLEGILPAKVICFLGMEEDFFKKENFSSLNLLEEKYFPTITDIKKDFFLRGILLAEEHLYFSYVNISEDGHKRDMAILIKDILSFIDKVMKKKKSSSLIFTHPLLSFDKNYFQGKKGFYSFSEKNYLQAKKYYLEKEKNSFFDFKKFLDNKISEIIDIRDLIFLANNPIKFYFNKVFKIFLEKKEEKTFFLTFSDRYRILQSMIYGGEKIVLKNLEKEGVFPSGYIKEAAKRELKAEIKKYLDNLKYLKIEKMFDFLFFLEKENIVKNDQDKIFSAFEINIDGKRIKIRGKIKNISEKGLILFSDSKLKNIIANWPKILIFLKAAERLKRVEKNIFCIKTKKKVVFKDFDIDKALIKFIRYYERALSNISPMVYDWSETLLFKDVSFFKKAVNSSKENNFYEDIYLKKFFEKKVDLEKIFNKWSSFLKDTFLELTDNCEIL